MDGIVMWRAALAENVRRSYQSNACAAIGSTISPVNCNSLRCIYFRTRSPRLSGQIVRCSYAWTVM